MDNEKFFEGLKERNVSRRDFMKFCGMLATVLGLSSSFIPKIAEALASPGKPPVVWLHFAECTGCSEAFLRSMYPWADELILDILSVDYHETLMAAAGHQAEEILEDTIKKYKGKFICVVEGAIPTKQGGVFGMGGGKTFLETADHVCKKALATIAIGTCSCYGGVQAAAPNPTGAKGVADAIGIKTINIPGCPPNPINFVGTIVNYLLMGKLPATDKLGRPLFAYGKTVHDQCPRRSHFEAGEFAPSFDSKEARKGWCLYDLGCKGPETYNNCPLIKFNSGTSWPVEAGHPCIGCSEPGFWDSMSPFYESL